MTPKQERFCLLYAETGNATKAYTEAGYSAEKVTVAGTEGYKLLKKPQIKERIAQLQAEAAAKAGLSIKWVLDRFKAISDRCMTAEPVMRFDPVEKAMVQETIINEFNEQVGVYYFDSAGANKATEAIGKHIGFFEKDNDQRKPVTNLKVGYANNDEAATS